MRSTDGWRVVSPDHGDRCGMVAHRGVLHADEYVNRARLLTAVQHRLGFTLAELHDVYCQGRKSQAQRELRARIDARLLELAHVGGNLSMLGRIVGVHPHTFSRALARAKAAEGMPAPLRVRCGTGRPSETGTSGGRNVRPAS